MRRFALTRRQAIAAGVAAGATIVAARGAGTALAAQERHGLSIFGDLKYQAGFPHFDYVNPQAPKGGTISLQISSVLGNQNFQTFNTLNVYILKGDGAAGMQLTFDSLMARAGDEPDAVYGLLARSVTLSEDGLLLRLRLRPEARFRNGARVTAADVVFSLTALKTKGHPIIAQAIRDLEAATAEADDLVALRFRPGRSRDAPLVVAQLPIFSADWYATRAFDETTLEAPMGSGPYRVGRFEAGRFIELDRDPGYWGRDLPVNVGRHNFDRVRFEYFRDRDVAFEAFSAGVFTFREEFTSRTWATRYDFPAVRDGRVRRETLADETPSGAQGWFINLRREKFADRRVREAIALAFDFEWTNKNIMFDSFRRVNSFFENSPMKAQGAPSPEEVALLEPFRASLPAEVFGEPFVYPVSNGSGQDRALLTRASRLLQEAGCRRFGDRLMLPGGQPLEIEFLDDEGSLERHTNPFIKNLALLGVRAAFRIVDPAQYQRRLEDFDFDMTVRRFTFSATPGEAMRAIFTSEAARLRGSQNLSGIADPAVDALVDKALAANTREELTTACRALDRVLRAIRPWVPQWFSASHRLAYWDMFGRPESGKPRYDRVDLSIWWRDAEKARRIGREG